MDTSCIARALETSEYKGSCFVALGVRENVMIPWIQELVERAVNELGTLFVIVRTAWERDRVVDGVTDLMAEGRIPKSGTTQYLENRYAQRLFLQGATVEIHIAEYIPDQPISFTHLAVSSSLSAEQVTRVVYEIAIPAIRDRDLKNLSFAFRDDSINLALDLVEGSRPGQLMMAHKEIVRYIPNVSRIEYAEVIDNKSFMSWFCYDDDDDEPLTKAAARCESASEQ